MADKRHTTRRGGLTGAVSRRRSRAAGAATAVGAFLAFGLGPLASAPAAQADEFDFVVDLLGEDLAGAFGDLT
ncbi:hypothetical protein, partial [Mycolicibacter arupensis]|uniref:hypothetical protein n=2 Tax=Mycolicibacter arupensis TaxID=342002 RepID=UPI0021F33683